MSKASDPMIPQDPTTRLYAERDHIAQGDDYLRHVDAMTGEGLHAKSAIAGELAHRDIEIRSLLSKLESAEARLAVLEGQTGVLVSVLRECDGVISTIQGECKDEDEALSRLLLTIKRVTLLRIADEDLFDRATTKGV